MRAWQCIDTHHIEGSLGQEALMCCVKLLLTCKVPAADVILVTVPGTLLLQVAPLLHSDTHSGYVRLQRSRCLLLENLSKEGRLSFVRCADDHHLHVVVGDAASEARLEVADDGLCRSTEEALIDGEVPQSLKIELYNNC